MKGGKGKIRTRGIGGGGGEGGIKMGGRGDKIMGERRRGVTEGKGGKGRIRMG